MRKVSIENCEIIGKGALGTVYKLDEETVVKKYDDPSFLPMAQNEQKKARQAFVSGIPTAIPFDVVEVDGSYGTVFELIKAQNCNDVLISKGKDCDDFIRQYADFIKSIHAVEAKPDMLPFTRDIYLEFLDGIAQQLPEDIYERIKVLLEKMPADYHVVHGDLQMKNIMLSGDEMMLIDMDTLSTGNPVFDLAGLFLTYIAFSEDEPDNIEKFLGITQEVGNKVYELLLNQYFKGIDEKTLSQAKSKIELLSYVRFMQVLIVLKVGNPELMDIRIKHSIEHMRKLLETVEDLCI